jgi:hypothetical protein
MAMHRLAVGWVHSAAIVPTLVGFLSCGSSGNAHGDAGPANTMETFDVTPAVDSHAVSDTPADLSLTTDTATRSDAFARNDAPSAADAASTDVVTSCGTVIQNTYITWYGFPDNSCQSEGQHDCATIAFPMGCGFPTPHNDATEGSGSYDDPVTFATSANDTGSVTEIPVGAIIYVPLVHKYFVMEDECAECQYEWDGVDTCDPPCAGSEPHPQGWTANTYYHTDLWMGPSTSTADQNPITNCEDTLTQGNPYAGTGMILVSPPNNLPVDTTPLFSGTSNTCTAHTYPQILPAGCG